jgi:nucleotide-binding universal stress UspA family protein
VYTTIVVPLDYSRVGERAIAPAAALSRCLRARLELVMVSSPGLDLSDDQRYLEKLAASADADVAGCRVLTSNDVASTVLGAVAADPEALLCMATHGRGSIAHAVLGSVAEKVVRGSDRPVVLVGPAATPPWSFDLVQACVEPGSDASHVALSAALTMALALDGTLWLVEVRPFGAGHRGDVDGERELAALAHGIRDAGIGVEWQVQDDERADVGILRAAASVHAGLIAMTTRARSGLARTALGSVTMDVVRHATCPVLVIPPTAASAQR